MRLWYQRIFMGAGRRKGHSPEFAVAKLQFADVESKFAPPFIATISLSGAVSMLYTHSALIKRVESR